MTKLFTLQPIGLGTPSVESLASYIARLAAEHSLSLLFLAENEETLKLTMPDDIHLKAYYQRKDGGYFVSSTEE